MGWALVSAEWVYELGMDELDMNELDMDELDMDELVWFWYLRVDDELSMNYFLSRVSVFVVR